jgi:hypothetical protein
MMNTSAGQRATVIHAVREMVFVRGAELICDSRSKSEDYERRKLGTVAGRIQIPSVLLFIAS